MEQTTEDKIKEAARLVFMQKGLGGARIKDIAEAAGINLALLNYYFRSKENLFDIIMKESLVDFFSNITDIINNQSTSLSLKIEMVTDKYTTMLLKQPDLPLFVLGEIRANPDKFLSNVGVHSDFLIKSYFMQQVAEQLKIAGLNIVPIHVFWNIISMIVFPFVTRPVFSALASQNNIDLNALLEERRTLIPIWVKSMLKINE